MSVKPLEIPADSAIASAYTLLSNNPNIGEAELASHLNHSEDELKELITRMTELSLILPAEHDETTFVTEHPMLAIRRMIVDEITILDERWQRLQNNYQALLSILPKIALKTFILTEERPPERLAGQHAIHQTLEELVAHSKQEILAFLPPPSDAVCTALAGRMLNLALRQPGVHTRAIYTDATSTVALGVPRPAQLAAAGIEIRIAADLPLNLIIVDRAVAVLPVEAEHPERGARLIRDSCTITALIALFESFWVTGQSFCQDESPVEECGALDRAILRQLATGNKDDAVARQLGISVRTLRRRIADLMQQVNAQSRFELAIEAATRGWVDSAAVH